MLSSNLPFIESFTLIGCSRGASLHLIVWMVCSAYGGAVIDRLHYIPLSNSYQEIYNIHAFFSGATETTLRAANSTVLSLPSEERKAINGDRRLRRIARAGKQWRRTFGRKEDMEGKPSHPH